MVVDLEVSEPFSCLSKFPLGMAETSGLGRLGAENTVLEARVQVLKPVPSTCLILAIPSGVWSLLFRLDDP